MHALFVDRDGGRGEPGIGERADRNAEVIGQAKRLVVDGGAAAGAEMEPGARAFVTRLHIHGRLAGRRDVLAQESRLLAIPPAPAKTTLTPV